MNKQTLSRNISKIFSMGINELIEFKKRDRVTTKAKGYGGGRRG